MFLPSGILPLTVPPRWDALFCLQIFSFFVSALPDDLGNSLRSLNSYWIPTVSLLWWCFCVIKIRKEKKKVKIDIFVGQQTFWGAFVNCICVSKSWLTDHQYNCVPSTLVIITYNQKKKTLKGKCKKSRRKMGIVQNHVSEVTPSWNCVIELKLQTIDDGLKLDVFYRRTCIKTEILLLKYFPFPHFCVIFLWTPQLHCTPFDQLTLATLDHIKSLGFNVKAL